MGGVGRGRRGGHWNSDLIVVAVVAGEDDETIGGEGGVEAGEFVGEEGEFGSAGA